MTQLANINNQTMSSREIAELTGKQHKHVLTDIRKMLIDLELGLAGFSAHLPDSQGKLQPVFNLNRELTDTLLTGYSTVARNRVIKRWHELEGKAALPSVKDPVLAAHIRTLIEVDAIKTEQQRQAIELAKVQETLAVVEARTQPENKHFTVLGWANLQGQKVDIGLAAKLGKRCAEFSRDQGIPIGDVSDPRFGKVHSYHESVLKQIVGEAL